MSGSKAPDEQQGVHGRGCAFCVLLHPGVPACPRCGGRPHAIPAQMLDRESVDRAVRRAVEALDGSRARLDALLGLLLVHRPVSLTALAEDGRITLDVLRAQDHVLAPDLVGLDPTAVRARLGAPDRRRDEEWHYDQETAPAHVVTVHVLRFAGGRVVEQMLRRRGVDCDPLA